MRCIILFVSQCLFSIALANSFKPQPSTGGGQDTGRSLYFDDNGHALSQKTSNKQTLQPIALSPRDSTRDIQASPHAKKQPWSSGQKFLSYKKPVIAPVAKAGPARPPHVIASFDRPYPDAGSKTEGSVKTPVQGEYALARHPQSASVSAKTRNGGIRSYATGKTVEAKLNLQNRARGMIHTTQPNGERTAEHFRGPARVHRVYQSVDPEQQMKIETDLDSGRGKAKSYGSNAYLE